SIISKPEGQAGFFQIEGRYFNIFPVNSTTSLLKEFDLAHLPNEGCSLDGAEALPRETDWCEPADNDCFAEINLLALITPDVLTWFNAQANQGQALLTIFQGLASINLAFANSGIFNKNVRIRMEVFNFNGFDSLLNILDDLNNDLPAQAGPIREQRQADVVIMLTSMDYPGIAGAAINPSGPGCPSDDCSYAIVEIQSMAGPRFTFAHEFAHLLHANHNRTANCSAAGVCGDNNENICAHALVFNGVGGAEHRTILARMTEPGAVRIPHYSNPDINFDGVATGDEDNDNARIMMNTACYVSGYNTADWTVGISGSTKWCSSQPSHTLTAAVSPPTPGWGYPGNPPYQYEWRWSCSPTFVTSQFLSNQWSVTLTNPLLCGGDEIWVRLTVTSSDGAVRVRNRPVVVVDCPNFGGETGDRSIDPAGSRKGNISISPNPVSDMLEISVDNDDVQTADVVVLDNLGHVVKHMVPKERGTVIIETNDLPSGIYFVLVRKSSKTEAHKIIVQH
ncbi:MAG: T9SS type A sorting domain-containing protein, partial [Saprospiraceae bacterium]